MKSLLTALPRFNAIDYTQVEAELSALLQANLAQIDALLNQEHDFTWANLMHPLEELDDTLDQFWGPISHLNSVKNSAESRQVYNACIPKLSDYGTAVSHNKKLYAAIKSIAEGPEYSRLDNAQKKVIDNNLRDFNLAGVSLNAADKQKFAELSKALSQLTTQFEENVLDASEAWNHLITDQNQLAGLPERAIALLKNYAANKQLDGWLMTLEPPCYIAIMTYADHQPLRKMIYTAYSTRASDQGPNANQFDNSQVMHEILQKRLQLAKLLGFNNYAERSLATKMVADSDQVLNFLEQLTTATLSAGKAEFKALTKFATKTLKLTKLEPWDIAYTSEKLRQAKFDISQEELRPYFPEAQALKGLFEVTHKLYNIRIEALNNVETWHPDVKVFALYSAQNDLVAACYFDLYAREGKRGGAWMDECL
nr:oligopeptidase A [Gammaproteobacteria bacterium]